MAETAVAMPETAAVPHEVTGTEPELSAGSKLGKETATNRMVGDSEEEPLRKKVKVEGSADGDAGSTHKGADAVAPEAPGAGGGGMEVDAVPEVKPAVASNDENVKKVEVGGGKGQEADTKAAAPQPPPALVRSKKRKIAILMGYVGAGYQGMQRNPGAKTIEGELELALRKAGAISDENFGDPRTIDWMRAARTDKGVSAVGQVVSGLFIIEPVGLIERTNRFLPQQIRIFDYIRVTKSFNAKQLCDRRRYEYVLPTFAFDPEAHRERSYNGLRDGGCEEENVDGSKNNNDGECQAEGNPNGSSGEEVVRESVDDKPCSSAPAPGDGAGGEATAKNGTGFKFTKEVQQRLNKVLKQFVGTHNFHNFTSRVDPLDPAANRYMLSFEAGEPFTLHGTEFVRCVVVGQSFMLHQIRKMIGCVVGIMRGVATPSVIDLAFQKDKFITVPMAPELGLFLDECLYASYNRRYAQTHQEVSLRSVRSQVDQFKRDVVYKHIADTDRRESVFATWLKSLNERNYSGFAVPPDPSKTIPQAPPRTFFTPPVTAAGPPHPPAKSGGFPVTVYPPSMLAATGVGKATTDDAGMGKATEDDAGVGKATEVGVGKATEDDSAPAGKGVEGSRGALTITAQAEGKEEVPPSAERPPEGGDVLPVTEIRAPAPEGGGDKA